MRSELQGLGTIAAVILPEIGEDPTHANPMFTVGSKPYFLDPGQGKFPQIVV